MEVATLLDGENACGLMFNEETVFADLVAECSIWEDIGLQLRTHHLFAAEYLLHETRSKRSYYIHHPDLSSDLIAPEHIPVARFQGLRITVDFKPETTIHETQPPRYDIATIPPVQQLSSRADHSYGLGRYPRPTPKARAGQKGPGPPFRRTQLDHDTSAQSGGTMEMGMLLEAALRKLIGVKTRASPGVRVVKTEGIPTLIDIAPAVWNLRYLQSMTAHTRVIPVIAEGIARLSVSRSSSLREKVSVLLMLGEGQTSQVEEDDKAQKVGDVRSQLWTLCQTRIAADPIKKNAGRRGNDASQTETQQSEGSNSLRVQDRHALEGLSSQSRMDSLENRHNWHAEHQDLTQVDEGPMNGMEEHYGVDAMYDQHVVYHTTQEQYSGVRYDGLQEDRFLERPLVMHDSIDHQMDVGLYEGMSGYQYPEADYREGLGSADFAHGEQNDEYFMEEVETLGPTPLDETDGPEEESEGDYYYVDELGNCYQIERLSSEDEGPESKEQCNPWESTETPQYPADW